MQSTQGRNIICLPHKEWSDQRQASEHLCLTFVHASVFALLCPLMVTDVDIEDCDGFTSALNSEREQVSPHVTTGDA